MRGLNAWDDYEAGKYSLGIGLWEAGSLELIWSATTHSYDEASGPEPVVAFAGFMIQTLRDRGFI